MNVLLHFSIFVSLLFSFQIHAQTNEGELVLKIKTRVGKTYIGTVRGGRKMAAVVCTKDLLGNWSADLVFSVKQDSDSVPELTLEKYRSLRIASTERRSPYVTLTNESATQFCESPLTKFIFKIKADRTATVSPVISRKVFEASSDH